MRKWPVFPGRIREGITEMKKKAILILSMILAVAFTLTGCSGAGALKGTEVVATLDDSTNMQLGEFSLMLRYEQAQMETYYSGMFGSDMFRQDMGEGQTYGDMVKDSMADSFEKMYILEAEAPNYGVELTEEEKTAISEAAAAFMEANTAQARKAMGVSQENVERVLSLMTLENKMYEALTVDVDTEVSDEEAAQKRINYVYTAKADADSEEEGTALEQNEAKQTALQNILDEVKNGTEFKEAAEAQELSMSELTYGADSTSPAEEVRAAADELAEGEFSSIIETDTGYYLVQMASTFDRDATDAKKETIVQNRKNELFEEKYAELAEAHTFTVNEEVLAKLTFERSYTLKMEE